ncbi:MAG: oxidoreductase [Gemmatimonadota bacterium]|nr:MAG: oxidoreductase [Gemmatimonadota bacterium]
MATAFIVQLSGLLLAIGAVASLATARRRRLAGGIATAFVAGFSALAWLLVVRTFTVGPEPEVTLTALPWLGAGLTLAVDRLSAFFLAVVATVAFLATLYSIDYMTHYRRDGVAKFYPVLLVFFGATAAVLVVRDFFFFLVAWELMTLTGFFLVVFERESRISQRAGLKYFIITHAATLCMLAAVLVLWSRSGSFHFAALRNALGDLLAGQPLLGHVVLLLFFLAFATKAGVLPMGDWLPDAHPVAPSGMSATLSGALVKIGIYGLVRVFVSFLPVEQGAATWGAVLALAGTGSLFVGSLTALRQHDSKRLLAFSTIEQIGYVVLGLGVGVAVLPSNPTLAALAFVGALFHVANHACFKSCLFLGAGAVLYRTGERDLDRLGGIGASMRVTAGSSTVAALAIAGVPPLNGFASKWLIVCSCILAGLRFPLYLVLGLVALFVSLVTLAIYLQVLGSLFLGTPRASAKVREVPNTMAAPQVVLAALCVVLGVVPFAVLAPLRDAVAAITPVAVPDAAALFSGLAGLAVSVNGEPVAFWAPLALVGGIVILGVLARLLARAGGAEVRSVPVWYCGEEHDSEEVRVPASTLFLPFKRAFEGIYPRLKLVPPPFPGWLRRVFEVDNWLYLPAVRLIDRGAKGVSRTHVGIPQVYLLWIVVGAVAVVGIILTLVR